MRARAATRGRKAGGVATSVTRSPSIHTERPSRIESLYSSPVLIMWYAFPYIGKCFPELTRNVAVHGPGGKPDGAPAQRRRPRHPEGARQGAAGARGLRRR